jgi:uncharacterized protein (DUF488 family)
MRIYTIGFTQTTAEYFFDRLKNAGIQRLLDTRLYHSSQLAGFAKSKDLPFFAKELAGVEYEHEPLLAPTEELLETYRQNKKVKGAWDAYVAGFQELMAEREIEAALRRDDFEVPTALLCSEVTAERCHRRLICEYLAERWPDLGMLHL